jgi:hypothetical protein
MPRPIPLFAAVLALAAGAAGAQEPDAEPAPLSVRVNVAIARGVRNLLNEQGADGLWRGDETRYPGGRTAFVAYTLVKSGLRRGDEALNEALRALGDVPHRSTYGTAARLLLYESLGEDDAYRERAQACLDSIVAFQREGLWAYPEREIDFSNVQFALLGLRAAHDMGLVVPERTLVDLAKAMWRLGDDGNDGTVGTGGFRYRGDVPATGGITAAALGSVALLEAFGATYPALERILKRRRPEIARAQEYLIERWDPARNAWGRRAWTPSFHHCYLWAVERTCELTGATRLGDHDWYAEGAEHLVATQNENGSFGSEVHDTCFALLFLRRTTFSGGAELEELYNGAADAADRARPKPVQLAADAPWLATCLVAGPLRGKDGDSGLVAPPFELAKLRPRAGTRVGPSARTEWEHLALKPDDWTNLEALTGRGDDMSLWLVATELTVEGEEPRDALLWFLLEDGWRIALDGVEVSRGERVQAPIRLDYAVQVPVRLAPGVHELVAVVEDAKGDAAFGLRLSDAAGQPLAGVSAGIASKGKR